MPSAIRGEASRVIGALLDRGLLVPRIARRFTLPEIAGAHELLESGDALGNIVVTLPIE
jgi:NADPH:quinone reductase-like Zn-dependent oxidoreductase